MEVVLTQAHVELRPRETETVGGSGLVAAGFLHHPGNRLPLDGCEVRRCRRAHGLVRAQRKMPCGDETAFGKNNRALERIAELTNVTGPAVMQQRVLPL